MKQQINRQRFSWTQGEDLTHIENGVRVAKELPEKFHSDEWLRHEDPTKFFDSYETYCFNLMGELGFKCLTNNLRIFDSKHQEVHTEWKHHDYGVFCLDLKWNIGTEGCKLKFYKHDFERYRSYRERMLSTRTLGMGYYYKERTKLGNAIIKKISEEYRGNIK